MPISLNWNTVAETDSLRDYLGNLAKCQCRILGSLFHTFYVKDCSGFEVRQ